MDELRELTKRSQRRAAYQTVLRAAFPPEELRPFWAMEKAVRKGEYHFLCMYRDDSPVAFLCLLQRGRYVLGDYLAVPETLRCGGIGSRALTLAQEYLPEDAVLFAETEAETGDPERDVLIRRRMAFYSRMGARTLPYDTMLFGVHYKTVAWAKEAPDAEAVMKAHTEVYRRELPPKLFRTMIKIPYNNAEQNEE